MVLPMVLFGASLVATCAAAAEAAPRPNVVVIAADDLGYADLGFQGCKDIPTPNLDGLARAGVRFTQAYVSGPYCSPSRAGLMTGRYQQRFGHEFNSGGPGGGLPVDQKTIADRLKAAGYVTGIVGKWHLGSAPEFHPLRRGFQEFFGFLGGSHTYFPAQKQSRTVLRGTEPVDEPEYLTDAFAREAVAFIERHRREPFFLYLAFNAVHTPMESPEKYLRRFEAIEDKTRRTYAAMTSAMDDAVGAVLAKLRDAGLEENTLVFFFSDNGGPTMPGTTINGSSNAPLRGSKRQTLEGGIHVPFVIAWKGRLRAGATYELPVIQLDVLPTALAAAGIDAAGQELDGVNLLPFLTGQQAGAPHDTLYWRFGQQMAIRRGEWKLVRYGATERIDPEESWPKLYNLAQDIGESRDLAAGQPARVKELEQAWQAWNAQLPKSTGTSGGQRIKKDRKARKG